MSVARADLRPLGLVTVQLSGAVNLQGITDVNGRVTFPGLPAGAITITPSRSGFRFEPPQLTIPDSANPAAATFTAFPTATDLALSIVTDEPSPRVGGLVNGVITLRNLGTAAATDIRVAFGSLPGLALESRDTAQGRLETRGYGTLWTLPQLNPGATAEVLYQSRATLPDANVLVVALIEEMDQTDTNPLNNTLQLITPTRPAQARLTLAMTINPVPVKVGGTLPVQLTVRNEGPQDATQIAIRSYCPPGASFLAGSSGLESSVVIPRLAAGAELQLNGTMKVRMAGTFTLIANVTYFEQQLPPGAAWPETRAPYTVQPASSHITLFGFTDPPNPRVGDDVNVLYVARNDGPDPVTGLSLFTRADWRLDWYYRFSDPTPPVPPLPGPFVFGDVLPVGAYTYQWSRYLVTAAGDLTNYFTVEYQDQLIPAAGDHPELLIPLKTLPADVGLCLDANPKDITVPAGGLVTIDFPVHNDGPQPARGIFVSYSSLGLESADLDEVIHADRTLRPGYSGYIDVVEPGETVLLRRHFVATYAGVYTNAVEINTAAERPDLLIPIATETIRLRVLPGPPPNLAIGVRVDRPQANVGEYAIFFVTVTNLAAQPAFNVTVREPHPADAAIDGALETVRSYGPTGDDRINEAWWRTIPRIEPGATYTMSRTVRMRKPGTIPYLAKIERANGVIEEQLPLWNATTQITGVQVTSDMAAVVVPDRTNVKNGDVVNFAIIGRNVSSTRVSSHPVLDAAQSAGFQVNNQNLGGYGYFWDHVRPRDLQSSRKPFWEWIEIRPQQEFVTWISTYTVTQGQFTASAQLSALDQLDAQANNNLALGTITSAAASTRVTVQQSIRPQNPKVGDLVMFTTEIKNEGPDRVTGLTVVETSSANLQLNTSAAVTGISGDLATSIWDNLVRLPALAPGQNFVWQRTYIARTAATAWRRVRVDRFDQTPLAPLPDNNFQFTPQAVEADLQLQFLETPPTVAQHNIPTVVGVRVRNFGPAVATGVRVAVNVPWDALDLGDFVYGPRATYVFLEWNLFQTALLPGESASVWFWVTPTRTGAATSFVQLQYSDQTDPNTANDTLSWTFNIGPEPPVPTIMRVRKVRTDFFDQTPIAEVEIDQAALNRLAPLSTFYLDRSSNLRDWEYLRLVGFTPLAPVTYTDHAAPGVTMRAYRLRSIW